MYLDYKVNISRPNNGPFSLLVTYLYEYLTLNDPPIWVSLKSRRLYADMVTAFQLKADAGLDI